MTIAQVCGCVRRLHPDLKQRVKEDTLVKYQKSFEMFTEYLQKQYDLVLTCPEDLDLLLMEFRTEADLTKAQHMTLVAAAEFFLPHVKGKLSVCREALRGRMAAEAVRHTVPLTMECAYLFSAWHASQGRPRIGAAMLIQHSTGLRPSELLALQPGHLHLPLDRSQSLTIRLGATYSTKVKREQYILVDPSTQALAFSLLARLVFITPTHERLFPFGYQIYNNAFKLAEALYELNLGTTAHSGRSGFATHLVLPERKYRHVDVGCLRVVLIHTSTLPEPLTLLLKLVVRSWSRQHVGFNTESGDTLTCLSQWMSARSRADSVEPLMDRPAGT